MRLTCKTVNGYCDMQIATRENKLEKLEYLKTTLGITNEEIAYMGDDLPDVPILNIVGIKACPNDAVDEVKRICNFKATANGGRGAVRELTDLIYYPAKIKMEKKPIELPNI